MAQIGAPGEEHIDIRGAVDVERARRAARVLTGSLGFSRVEQEMVTLSVSELATNLVRYAVEGSIVLRATLSPNRIGIEVESRDRGPGIATTRAAVHGGRSTGEGLGAGLAAVRRLMDDFELHTAPTGTIVICRRWRSLP
jgi:serine/threonine-protein kinase RsbT